MCRRIKYKGQTVECEQTDRRTRPIALPSLSITRRRRDGSSTVAKIAAGMPAVRTGQWRNDGVVAASSDGGPHWW